MTCDEFLNLPGEDAAHLAECPACAARQANERPLCDGLKLLAAEMRTEQAPARVEAGLVAAFRMTHARPKRRGFSIERWLKMPAPVAWAAAGCAAAALAFGVWITPHAGPVAPAPAAHHSSTLQIELANNAETDDGFIPIPDAPQIDPNEDVNVVRMELPGTAMLAVGLDVTPDQLSGTVEAEVKLGADGLPRAVRFLD